jgi:hypothetical protein
MNHLNSYGAEPPLTVGVNVIVVPAVCGLARFAVKPVSLIDGGRTVQSNERDTVVRPSDTNNVTLKTPVDVGVPVMTPSDESNVSPNGNPECEY